MTVIGSNGFIPTQFGRNLTNPANVKRLTIDQKKNLVIEAVFLEQILNEAKDHS